MENELGIGLGSCFSRPGEAFIDAEHSKSHLLSIRANRYVLAKLGGPDISEVFAIFAPLGEGSGLWAWHAMEGALQYWVMRMVTEFIRRGGVCFTFFSAGAGRFPDAEKSTSVIRGCHVLDSAGPKTAGVCAFFVERPTSKDNEFSASPNMRSGLFNYGRHFMAQTREEMQILHTRLQSVKVLAPSHITKARQLKNGSDVDMMAVNWKDQAELSQARELYGISPTHSPPMAQKIQTRMQADARMSADPKVGLIWWAGYIASIDDAILRLTEEEASTSTLQKVKEVILATAHTLKLQPQLETIVSGLAAENHGLSGPAAASGGGSGNARAPKDAEHVNQSARLFYRSPPVTGRPEPNSHSARGGQPLRMVGRTTGTNMTGFMKDVTAHVRMPWSVFDTDPSSYTDAMLISHRDLLLNHPNDDMRAVAMQEFEEAMDALSLDDVLDDVTHVSSSGDLDGTTCGDMAMDGELVQILVETCIVADAGAALDGVS